MDFLDSDLLRLIEHMGHVDIELVCTAVLDVSYLSCEFGRYSYQLSIANLSIFAMGPKVFLNQFDQLGFAMP